MYALAGYVAEVLGDSTWERLITKHIFQPLNMTESNFSGRNPTWDNMASPYILHNQRITKLDKILAM